MGRQKQTQWERMRANSQRMSRESRKAKISLSLFLHAVSTLFSLCSLAPSPVTSEGVGKNVYGTRQHDAVRRQAPLDDLLRHIFCSAHTASSVGMHMGKKRERRDFSRRHTSQPSVRTNMTAAVQTSKIVTVTSSSLSSCVAYSRDSHSIMHYSILQEKRLRR